MWVSSDVISGCNWRCGLHADAGDAEDGKTTADVAQYSARASDG